MIQAILTETHATKSKFIDGKTSLFTKIENYSLTNLLYISII